MEDIELVFILLAVVAAITVVSRRIGVPYPILMVIAGLLLGIIPGSPLHIELEPDIVLLVFLPPILFSAAYLSSPRELWRNVRPIGLLAVGLVIITTAAVALVAMLLVPEIGLALAAALGAIVSPPDAIAATTIARRLNLPRRLVVIFEGESLVNDATALTFYGLAVSAIGVATVTVQGVAIRFGMVTLGGVLIGLVVGRAAVWLLDQLNDSPVEVLLTLLVPFAAYLPADQLGVSGVLSTVTAGLFVGWYSPRIMTSSTRVLGMATWQMVVFVVNGLAFLLVGLQLPTVLADIEGYEPIELLGMAAAISATVIIVRLLWIYPATYVPRWLFPGIARRDPAPPVGVPLILGWGGMRGAVSMAAALALPHQMNGAELEGRGLLIFLTFSVILVTLVGQGLTLPSLIRALGVSEEGEVEDEEIHARSVAAEAALVRLVELRTQVPGHLPLIDELTQRYEHIATHLVEQEDLPEATDGTSADGAELTPKEQEEMEHDEIRRAVIAAEREAVLALRDTGEIGEDALHAVERDLDLDELRRET
ncbi:MAG TPA: Na+/H+ antiporter [Candidatus Limnocylindria bacterium]|nr:Na+/H+ antiporter [Candidatus Limnocylindria bacterium]